MFYHMVMCALLNFARRAVSNAVVYRIVLYCIVCTIFLMSLCSGRGIDILLAQDKKQQYVRKTLLTNESIPVHRTIAGIMLADFNGDVLMDVLVTTKEASTGKPDSVQISVYWGNGTGIDIGVFIHI